MILQKNLLEYLEGSAALYPDKTAFTDEDTALSFSQLLDRVKRTGTYLASLVPHVNRPVAVMVDRNVGSLAAFMGVLYSGNFYVPLDNQMPVNRITSILKQLEPVALLFFEKDRRLIGQLELNCPAVCYDETLVNPINEAVLAQRRGRVLDIDPAYVIFTSGSTGEPKGIVISHRSVIDFIEWMAEACGFNHNDVMGNQAPFYFDLSVKDIYLTLKLGATTHILSKKLFMFPMLLMQYIEEKKVTALVWATSAFNLIANSGVLSKIAPSALKKVVLGGEALHAKQLNIWRAALPQVCYINLYGPTEVTVDCTYYIIDRPYSDGEVIPIGKACENKEVMLLDEDLKPVQPGEPGEICVRGIGLAKGYYGDFEKTARAFVQNPFNNKYSDLIYRTGDLGKYNPDGLIVFLSRKDGQIKHMGYRIELGEVEAAVLGLKEVKNTACFFDEANDRIVCAYEGEISSADIISGLRKSLPKYMFPNIFMKLESLPYNANGKIDRVRLKESYYNEADKHL
ncbi:MAG: amino acid adenylation domain-containing protein [Papillibacter sp.]|nr:amino acid adenylation domain-containing protein [Papillibacter sp.]